MKYIIIGLGSFGSSLGAKLTNMGHEVIGVDTNMSKVEAMKERLTHTICMDSTDPQAVTHLPLKETDTVIVGIGEDQGANIMVTALMKQLKVKRIISRAINPLHQTVLEAMGVDEIVHPEEETAARFAKMLNVQGIINSFELGGEYNIVEANVPARYAGKTLEEAAIGKNYNVVVLTTIKISLEKNLLGVSRKVRQVQEVASSRTKLEAGDRLVLYGNIQDIQKLLKEE
ncbi:MAG: potassium channel family protein [Bacteroidia bacterium]